MRNVIGSLGWAARQRRPDLGYHVSRPQEAAIKAAVKDSEETNYALDKAQVHSDAGSHFEVPQFHGTQQS